MVQEHFWSALKPYQKAARLFEIDEDTHAPVTKIGGVPWWPSDVIRPRCPQDHAMSFAAQFLTTEVPSLSVFPPMLLSFHYCLECAWAGNMSFGESYTGSYDDSSLNLGYDISFFTDLSKVTPDDIGVIDPCLTEDVQRLSSPLVDSPIYDDIEALIDVASYDITRASAAVNGLSAIYPGELDLSEVDSRGVHYPGSKLGGWPSWVQYCEYPKTLNGNPMTFIAQLDGDVGDVPWVNGYVYLFAYQDVYGVYKGTFVMQTT